MPRLNRHKTVRLTQHLDSIRASIEGVSPEEIASDMTKKLGFQVSPAQVANIAEDLKIPLEFPDKPKRVKNELIMLSLALLDEMQKMTIEKLNRIEEKLDKVIED